eukprot:COSAG01_NODE_15695_length_1309_cov_2.839489_2_plen_117_part_00
MWGAGLVPDMERLQRNNNPYARLPQSHSLVAAATAIGAAFLVFGDGGLPFLGGGFNATTSGGGGKVATGNDDAAVTMQIFGFLLAILPVLADWQQQQQQRQPPPAQGTRVSHCVCV